MNNIVKVYEKDLSRSYQVSSFSIHVVSIELNVSVSVSVSCYDSNGHLSLTEFFVIDGIDYANWSNDDDYLKQLIASKLGLVVKPNE
jgi:hypothetical protein